MTDNLRDLLNRVASGEISPEDAQARMEADATPSSASRPTGPDPAHTQPGTGSSAEAGAGGPVARISIRASAVRLVVVADPTVDTAVAEGPHRVAREGDALTIHSDLAVGEYTTETPKSAFASWLGSVNRAGSTLRVRVNPNLPLDVLNVAGSLELSGLRAPTRIGVEAGSARVHGGAGQLALSVASGSAEVEWQFLGTSSVSTDLGSARVTVLPGSDVAVTAGATVGMASIRLADGTTIKASPAGNPPVVVGPGTGRLTVTSRLGSLVVSVP